MRQSAKITPQNTSIAQFDYLLPDEKIARYPVTPRDHSKLLVYKEGVINSDFYYQLHQHLPEGALLLMNNTKVVEARLLFKKSTGSTIEIFCLEPDPQYADMTTAMLQTGTVLWKCLVGGARKWKAEALKMAFLFEGIPYTLSARINATLNDTFLIEFSWNHSDLSFAEVLHHAGVIPLPPYLKRATEAADQQNYQTVYALQDGSVAAPTAGLHFTEELLAKLAVKQIEHDFLTLHVGAGTFMPVKSDTLADHEMHAEFIEVSIEILDKLLNAGDRKVIAVGTTSLRTLESLYWMGVKALKQPELSLEQISIRQWDAYELEQEYSAPAAFLALKQFMEAHQLKRLITKTQLLIAPGYTLRTVDAIITNFHQPQSTLLLLIHAFVGDRWKDIYDYALQHDYRFLSYGDGSLLWRSAK